MPPVNAAFLTNFRRTALARGLSIADIVSLTQIDRPRILNLRTADHEPFLDEAFTLHRALLTGGIVPLITASGVRLPDMNVGIPMPSDLVKFRAGMRIPLSLACRVAIKLGLPDPADLVSTPLQRDVWGTLCSRSAICPWCGGLTRSIDAPEAPDGHLATCLPNNLWTAREHKPGMEVGALARPIAPGKKRRASGQALGLQDARERACKRSKDVAALVGMDATYYSKIENGRLSLTIENAEKIAEILRCDVACLYAAPVPAPPVSAVPAVGAST